MFEAPDGGDDLGVAGLAVLGDQPLDCTKIFVQYWRGVTPEATPGDGNRRGAGRGTLPLL